MTAPSLDVTAPGPAWEPETGEDSTFLVPLFGDATGWSAVVAIQRRPGGTALYTLPAEDVEIVDDAVSLLLPGETSRALGAVLATGCYTVVLTGPAGASASITGLFLMRLSGPLGGTLVPGPPDPSLIEQINAAVAAAVPDAVQDAIGDLVGGYRHDWSVPALLVQVPHGLPYSPAGVQVKDSLGVLIDPADVTYPLPGIVELHFGVPVGPATVWLS